MKREQVTTRARIPHLSTVRATLVVVGAAIVAVTGCSRTEEQAPKKEPMPATTIAITGTPRAALSASPVSPPADAGLGGAHIAGNNFTIDLAAPACTQGADCTLTIHLSAGAGYHINKEYPYKFVATEAPGVTFLGKPEATSFSRASGDFHEATATTATMSVRFRPSAKGTANVSGTFKMSVCSEANCQVEQQHVALNVPVS